MSRCQVCGGSLAGKRADATFCGSACRQRAYRIRNGSERKVVTSAVVGGNADLIAQVAKLYLRPGLVVADVTFGRGVFWRKVDVSKFDFRPTDLETGVDFRNLPYKDSEVDVLVLDPPYLANKTSGLALRGFNDAYRIEESGVDSSEDLIDLYRGGMEEAHRVVRPGGQVWVKCQDGIEWTAQHWNHIAIHDIAVSLGWVAKDLFIFVSRWRPMRWPYQRHSRKNHSYLWVFDRA